MSIMIVTFGARPPFIKAAAYAPYGPGDASARIVDLVVNEMAKTVG